MKYYLVELDIYFYDLHGTANHGGFLKTVMTEDLASGVTEDGTYITTDSYQTYLNCKSGNEITDEVEEVDFFLQPEDWEDVVQPAAMDGYNYLEEVFTFKEISKKEYYRYAQIINDYNLL